CDAPGGVASAAGAAANAKYCIHSETTKSALHETVKNRRARALITRQSPRDAIVKNLRSPRCERRYGPRSLIPCRRPHDADQSVCSCTPEVLGQDRYPNSAAAWYGRKGPKRY